MKIYILSIPSLLLYRISSSSSSHTPHPSSFIHYLSFLLTHAPPTPPPLSLTLPLSPPLPLSLALHLSYISSPHSSFPSLTHFPSLLLPPVYHLIPHPPPLTTPPCPSSHTVIPLPSFLSLVTQS